MESSALLTILLDAFAAGVLVAFVAVGYSLIYGLLRFVNFAHGDVLMASAVVAASIPQSLQSWPLVLVTAAAVGAAIGVSSERFVYRPLRSHGALVMLLASFALSLLLRSAVGLIWGSGSRVLALQDESTIFGSGGFRVSYIYLFGALVVSGLVLEVVSRKTILGLTVRGFARDPEQVVFVGGPVESAIVITFGAAGALAGVAGVFAGNLSGVHPQMGNSYGLWAFTAAVIGGIGRTSGALIGGLVMGAVLSLCLYFLPASFADAAALIVLTSLLLLRPRGLLAAAERVV